MRLFKKQKRILKKAEKDFKDKKENMFDKLLQAKKNMKEVETEKRAELEHTIDILKEQNKSIQSSEIYTTEIIVECPLVQMDVVDKFVSDLHKEKIKINVKQMSKTEYSNQKEDILLSRLFQQKSELFKG